MQTTKNLFGVLSLFCFYQVSTFALATLPKGLSPTEEKELEKRLENFYAPGHNPRVMNTPIPKFTTQGEQAPLVHPELLLKSNDSHFPLSELAQQKADPAFRENYCKRVQSKQYPGFSCTPHSTDAAPEEKDKVATLTQYWIAPEKLTYNLDRFPPQSRTHFPIWSGDYWRTLYGQTSYRYSRPIAYGTHSQAIEAYQQPFQWQNTSSQFAGDLTEVNRQVLTWSPAEKYDLSLHEEAFNLTTQQKNLGKALAATGELESWMGICHGWAAASVMAAKPKRPVTVVGPKGSEVTWYPNDIKAMLSLAWANGQKEINYTGTRCLVRNPVLYPNGRIAEQECFDTNPVTFHLALGNMLGLNGTPFIMDATFDYEVWNQPIYSYSFTYFNPYDPNQRSTSWRDVAAVYDANFKNYDRFQNPLTRGIKKNGKYDDTDIRYVVGVISSVVYFSEANPLHTPENQADTYTRVTYTYDLEIGIEKGLYVATGGEWHNNGHPDFLWIPKKGTVAQSTFDQVPLHYEGNAPSPEATQLAAKSSQKGMPLCRFLKYLVGHSTDSDSYHCPAIP